MSRTAGEPFRDRPLRLLAFCARTIAVNACSEQDLLDGFALTGRFLLRNVLEPRGQDHSDARAGFIRAVTGPARGKALPSRSLPKSSLIRVLPDSPEENNPCHGKTTDSAEEPAEIHEVPLRDALEERYLAYALSTIMHRALPDARDGLKPVHRRILYGMRLLGSNRARPSRNPPKIVGDVMGSFHPHGDQAIYDAMVRLAKDFSSRYPLVDSPNDAMLGVPAAAHVARHVGEQEIMIERMPDRPLGEGKPGPDLVDRRLWVDQVAEIRPQGLVAHWWRSLRCLAR